MTWTHMNLVTTCIASLNMISLILSYFTSHHHDDRMTVCHYHRIDSTVGPYNELLRETDENVNQVKKIKR